jgi:hypothetical protein
VKRVRIPVLMLVAAALAACTGTGAPTGNLQPLTSEGLGVSPDEDQPASGAQAALPAAAQITAAALPAGPIATDARVQFTPVMGATPEALPPLSMRLAARAGQRGVPLVREGGAATHLMRGYFSAFTENRETTIIFVWDVTDAAGNRLHRIQGQQKLPAGSQAGWKSVTPAMMEAIADRTIDELAMWLAARAG